MSITLEAPESSGSYHNGRPQGAALRCVPGDKRFWAKEYNRTLGVPSGGEILRDIKTFRGDSAYRELG